MSKKRKILLYGAYVVLVTGLCLYLRFPKARFRNALVGAFSRAAPDLKVSIGTLRPTLPAGIRLGTVVLDLPDQGAIRVDRIDLSPRWRSLFGGGRQMAFDVRAAGGRISGTVGWPEWGKWNRPHVKADLAGIDISRLIAPSALMGRRISGTLSGTVTVTTPTTGPTATAHITVAQAKATLKNPFFGIEALGFKSITATATIDGTRAQLAKCRFSGREVAGEIKGTIALATPLEKSTLALTGEVSPGSGLMDRLKSQPVLAGLLAQAGPGKPLRVELFGTLEAPQYRLR